MWGERCFGFLICFPNVRVRAANWHNFAWVRYMNPSVLCKFISARNSFRNVVKTKDKACRRHLFAALAHACRLCGRHCSRRRVVCQTTHFPRRTFNDKRALDTIMIYVCSNTVLVPLVTFDHLPMPWIGSKMHTGFLYNVNTFPFLGARKETLNGDFLLISWPQDTRICPSEFISRFILTHFHSFSS